MQLAIEGLTLLFCYILGCYPSGLAVGLGFYRVDLRKRGSGNIGATNAWRELGKPAGVAVFLLDAGKALGGVALAAALAGGAIPYLPLLAGGALLLGNFFNIFLGFSGGKGVATSFGVFLGLATWPLLISTALFFFLVKVTGYVSVGSLAAAVAMPMLIFLIQGAGPLLILMCIISALIIYKHRSNIGRLMRGEEKKVR